MSMSKKWFVAALIVVMALIGANANALGGQANAATSPYAYSAKGEYLNYAETTPIELKSNVKLDANGVIMVRHTDGKFYYNPVTISQYGLQRWSRWKRTGDPVHRWHAVLQANWLVKNQKQERGIWTYDKPWSVSAFNEVLPAGWASAMAQGQAMSLLTRVGTAYPGKRLYMDAARRAYRPFVKTVANGGLVATYKGGAYYEEYPTRTAPSLTLNGFQFSLIGLYDLWQAGFPTAKGLFTAGYATMTKALPDHDAFPSSTYHLGHLTKPPRNKHISDSYHRIHVRLLYTLDYVQPNRIAKQWADKWSTYPAMTPTPPAALTGDGDLAFG